jgi:hypothetical protein
MEGRVVSGEMQQHHNKQWAERGDQNITISCIRVL